MDNQWLVQGTDQNIALILNNLQEKSLGIKLVALEHDKTNMMG